jgi:hypothetical protein
MLLEPGYELRSGDRIVANNEGADFHQIMFGAFAEP